MSEWIHADDIDALRKLAETDPRMALEVARAAYRRSLNAGLSPEEAYVAVLAAMRDIVPDPGVYADHVMGEGGRFSSIMREGIYHKGKLVFLAADIGELAERKREQIMARPDIAKLAEEAQPPVYWRDLPIAAQTVYREHWMKENPDATKALKEAATQWVDQRYDDVPDRESRIQERFEAYIYGEVKTHWDAKAQEQADRLREQRQQYDLIRNTLGRLPDDGFKLFDFVVREIKRGRLLPPDAMNATGIDQAIDRTRKVVFDAAVMLNELAKRNKPFPNYNAKDFTLQDLESWLYGDEDNRKLLNSLNEEDFEIGPGYDADYDKVVYTMPDGWTIRELPGEYSDLNTEGTEMQHCIRHVDEYHWDDKIHENYSRIFSLRDPLNYPHATIEFAADRGIPERDGTWYLYQMYGKQDETLDKFPDYERRVDDWFKHLHDEFNVTVTQGDHDYEYGGDDDDEEEEEHEPQHLEDMDETIDGPTYDISDATDLEQYWDDLHGNSVKFTRDDEGEMGSDEDGDYWYVYENGQIPEVSDPQEIAAEVFSQLGDDSQSISWGYEMMEALLFAVEHEQVEYGGLNPTERESFSSAVEEAAQEVIADMRPQPEDDDQLSFEDEGHPDFEIPDWETHSGISAEGVENVRAALSYFRAIVGGRSLYDQWLPRPDEDYYGQSPSRAFERFQDSKPIPETAPGPALHGFPEQRPLNPGERADIGPHDEEGNATGWQVGRDPNTWRRDLYNEWKQDRDMEAGGDDGTLEAPNIIGTAAHPDQDQFGAGQMGWTPNGHVFVMGEGGWVPMHPAGMNAWGENIRASMPMEPQTMHPDYERDENGNYRHREGSVVTAADIRELADKMYKRLDAQYYEKWRQDYVARLPEWSSKPGFMGNPDSRELQHPFHVWGIVIGPLRERHPESFKLWPWLAARIGRQEIPYRGREDGRHIVDIVGMAGTILQDMRTHNKSFDINSLKTFPELEAWVYENQPEAGDQWADSQTVYTFKDGWTIAKVGADDCVREGELMGHCVGGYGQYVEDGETEIYSLRDPKGQPHVTLELSPPQPALHEGEQQPRGTAQALNQIQGKSNSPPIDEYKQRLREWFNENNRTTDNQIVWSDAYSWGYDSDSIRIDDLRDFHDWWEKFQTTPAKWTGACIVITTENGEYGLRKGIRRDEEESVSIKDEAELNRLMVYALHADSHTYQGATYWPGHNEAQDMAQALYYLAWVTGDSFENWLEALDEAHMEIDFENHDANWGHIRGEINNRLETEYGERIDLENETLDGDEDAYQEVFEEARDAVEQEQSDYEWDEFWKFMRYAYHLGGIYPKHEHVPEERDENGARVRGPRVEKSAEEPPPSLLSPAQAEAEFNARQLQPSLPEIFPGMLTQPELAKPIPDEIKHMEDAKEVDRQKMRVTPGRVPDPRLMQQGLDDALAALSRPMEASSLDWIIERHPNAPGMLRISNMRLSSDGRAYGADETPSDGFLTHVVAHRDLLLDGYAVTDRTGELALVPLQ